MTYSTGSGDYNALMSAVLTHALSDGWTEDGGLETGYPIVSPSGAMAFDWTTYTAVEDDVTVGGGGGLKTQRYMRLGIGTTGANATSNASSTTTIVPNMAYTFSEWHIFSDTSVSEHIHVVASFSNGPNADCWVSFSFGELDKGGLTYGGISYATANPLRGYAVNSSAGSTSQDWNFGMPNIPFGWTGVVGEAGYITRTNISFFTQSTNAPHPNGAGGWPAWDTVIQNGDSLWNKMSHNNTFEVMENVLGGGTRFRGIQFDAWTATAPSQTGTITLMPMPFLLINSTGTGGSLMYAGTFPNVRQTNVKDVNPGDEVTYGSETWKLFPLLRKTDWSLCSDAGVVTSGYAGLAFKKVV